MFLKFGIFVRRNSSPKDVPLETSSEFTYENRSFLLTECNDFLQHMSKCLNSTDTTLDTMFKIKNISRHNLKKVCSLGIGACQTFVQVSAHHGEHKI